MYKSSKEMWAHSAVWALPSLHEWWQALRWVLLTFTLVVVLTLAGSFVPYDQVVSHGHPWLPRINCPGCILCGMTRSFCALSSGRWAVAWHWNHGGPFLYTAGWLWVLGSALYYSLAFKVRFMKPIHINFINQ